MERITNSPVKEAMRQKNEEQARKREIQIRDKHSDNLVEIWNSSRLPIWIWLPVVFAFGFVGTLIFVDMGALIGVIIGAICCIGVTIWKKIQGRKEELLLEAHTRKAISDAYAEADRRTVQEINAYDKAVQEHCQRLMQKPDVIAPMVDSTVNMFQRMVSHVNAAANVRFLEADFCYRVLRTGIQYNYQSGYTNPMDDFNFDARRFRNLQSDVECEGLAEAVARLTIRKMKSLYPPNSLHITLQHVDAEVSMHFKAANKNFVAAKDIF